jgi:hypothetical protein
MELNVTHQYLVCTEDVNSLHENTDIIKKKSITKSF